MKYGFEAHGNIVQSSSCHGACTQQDKRLCVTQVLAVCDQTEVQPHLPQFTITNCRTVTAKQFKAVRAKKPRGSSLFREKSAWTNSRLTCLFMKHLRAATVAFKSYQVIVLMDTASPHLAREVLTTAASADIWVCPVPPGTTGTCQPLDVGVLGRYKRHVLDLCQTCMTKDGEGLSRFAWLEILSKAGPSFLRQHAWKPVFDRIGLYRPGDGCLNEADFQLLLPRKRKINRMDWLCKPLQGKPLRIS